MSKQRDWARLRLRSPHPCATLYEHNYRTRHGNEFLVALQLCWGVFNDVPSTLHFCKEVFATLYYRYFWHWKNASNVLINVNHGKSIVRWLLQNVNLCCCESCNGQHLMFCNGIRTISILQGWSIVGIYNEAKLYGVGNSPRFA